MARCAWLSLVAAVGCGARQELIVAWRSSDAATVDVQVLPDASPDASQDASPDVADASADPQCSLGPIVTLTRRMEPSFLLSMVALPRGGYAYTMASGWSGFASPSLFVLDASLREVSAVGLARLETVHALDGDPRLYTVTSERDPARGAPVEHALYTLGAGSPQRTALGALCDGCRPSDRAVAQGSGVIAVPIGTTALDGGGVQLVQLPSGRGAAQGTAMDLPSPAVLSVRDGWLVAARSSRGDLTRALFARDGSGARALVPVSVGFDAMPVALARAGDGAIVAVGANRGGGRIVPVTMAVWASEDSLADAPTITRTIAPAGPTAQGLSAVARSDQPWIAVSWGEQTGERGGGAWLTVIDTQSRRLFEPTMVSDAVSNSMSYTVYTAVAPHPEGFVVAWNGWQPSAQYAIYARVVRCR